MRTTDFIKACHDGNLAEARQLLPDADINGSNEVGQGALLSFYPEITEFLLENGADPDTQYNENGASVLAGLAHVRKAECVRRLLAGGADPDKGRVESGETPLHHVLASDFEVVDALLKAGADPNCKAKVGVVSFNLNGNIQVRGETPLHRAAAYAPAEIIELLLESGADQKELDANGDSPSAWAIQHGRGMKIVQLLS